MKASGLILLLTLVGATVFNSNVAEAAPVSHLLSTRQPVTIQDQPQHDISPSPKHHSNHNNKKKTPAASSTSAQLPFGRAQIKYKSRTRASPCRHRSGCSQVSHLVKQQHQEIERLLASLPKPRLITLQSPEWNHDSNMAIKKMNRVDRHNAATLEGHAVVDEEDDDAGNELLDTEDDGTVPPDDDDTIEGEVIEEEEEDTEEDMVIRLQLEMHWANADDKKVEARENGLQDIDLVVENLLDE
ncbi:hypothetical protein EDD21DRAFT_386076 [Dissophora ornata]|nr:hypothetical protein BGZ58_006370 [Dissophora ornata]KAI8597187.1 hypothetical protein EDD21DRAFT_386076 [Dissophora ornata]